METCRHCVSTAHDSFVASCFSWFSNLVVCLLERFTVSDNELEGSIPTELGSLPVLRTLWLNGNKFSGVVPASLFAANSTQAIGKSIFFPGLQSSDKECHRMSRPSHFKFSDISSNALTGTIPSEIGLLRSLATFAAAQNGLVGQIPMEFGSMEQLIVSFFPFILWRH